MDNEGGTDPSITNKYSLESALGIFMQLVLIFAETFTNYVQQPWLNVR